MALVVALLLVAFVVPAPWSYVLLGTAIVYEVGTTWAGWRWSRSRPDVVGAAALVGRVVRVDREGWARVHGERWQVRGAAPGEEARVVAVDGLTLVVERV